MPVVRALMALRGIDFIAAITIVAEIGDLRRFPHPRELMGYLGLVPSEYSSGDSTQRGQLTKTATRASDGFWSKPHGITVSRRGSGNP